MIALALALVAASQMRTARFNQNAVAPGTMFRLCPLTSGLRVLGQDHPKQHHLAMQQRPSVPAFLKR